MLVTVTPDYTTPVDTTTSIGVNPDFNAEALSLVKYMNLNEDDRFAIGHRLETNYRIGKLYSLRID